MRATGLVFAMVLAVMLSGSLWGAQSKTVSVEELVYDLKHPNAERRRQAALVLGQHKVRSAVPALIEASQDEDEAVRLEVVRALVRINDPRALNTYIRLTRDSNRSIQDKVIEGIINTYVVEEGGLVQGLRKVVDFVNPFSDDYNPLVVEPYQPVSQEAILALAELLGHPNSGVRKHAATALGILRARPVLDRIQSHLESESDSSVKVELIRAVYKIADPGAGASLIPLVRDPDRRVRDEAIFALGRLRVREAAPVLKELYEAGIEERRKILKVVPVSGTDELQRTLLEALSYIGDRSCQEIFVAALDDRRSHFRRYGAEGLGRMGEPDVTTLVAKHYLREKSEDARLAMSYALYRLGREEHLVELVDNIDKDQVYYYFLELQPGEVPKLIPYIHQSKDSIRVRLIDVVGQRGDASAIPMMEQMTQSQNPEVVSAANMALRRLRGRFPSH